MAVPNTLTIEIFVLIIKDFMKKSIMKGMTVLVASMAFASCSHESVYDPNYAEKEQAFKAEQVKSDYKANFEKKYGKIDPNQSWDFTDYSEVSHALTRASQQSVSSSRKELFNGFKKLVMDDRDQVKSIDFTTGLKPWNPNFSAKLYPAYCHAIEGVKYTYYHIGIVENGESPYDVLQTINTKSGYWYDAQKDNSAMNSNSGRTINSKALQTGSNSYWVAYYTYPKTGEQEYKNGNKNVMDNISSFKIDYYKEIIVNGDKYWCFDCNHDGDFSDLIALVDDADPAPIRKRYMIEDLGATDDFDFNDIVVDVIQESNGSQKAQIRAMGGTLNFTLNIGNASWTKKGSKVSVGGALVDTDYKKMYNTEAPSYDLVLAEFPVTGWDFVANNISVSVEGNDNQSVIQVIPFPKKGDAPMIVAFDPITTHWNLERDPFDSGFYEPLGE
jgi:hypothetical protein